MYKKFYILVVMLVIAVFFNVFSAPNKVKNVHKLQTHTAQIVTSEMEGKFIEKLKKINPNSTRRVKAPPEAVEVGRTWYDYACNNQIGRMLSISENGVHFSFMKIAADSAERYVTYNFYIDSTGEMAGEQSFTEVGRTGWGRVETGINNEVVCVMHGGSSQFRIPMFIDQGEAQYSFTDTELDLDSSLFPSIDLVGTDIVMSVSDTNHVPSYICIGSDYTLHDLDIVPFPYQGPDTLKVGIGDAWPVFNPSNTDSIAVAYMWSDTSTIVDTLRFPGALVWANSVDNAATWTEMLIYEELYIIGDNTYYVDNFGQISNIFTTDGVFHIAFNGYGGKVEIGPNTILYNRFPLVYFNTRDIAFKELTTPTVTERPDDFQTIQLSRPGNSMGSSYPTMASTDNGDTIVVLWQQLEFDNAGVLRMCTANPGVIATDIHGAISLDGGTTWETSFKIAGTDAETDMYPSLAEKLTRDNNGDLWAHFMYLVDPIPGTSLFDGGGLPGECIWYYQTINVNDPPTKIYETGLHAVNNVFTLKQNYPNPFNLRTSIYFSLNKGADVKLAVYNSRGEKVAVLVDGCKKAGEYTVELNAENLSSGIYIYKFSAGNQIKSHKMLLMK